MKIVCFDIDGTLVEGNSWLYLTKGLGASTKKHIEIFHQARKGKISFEKAEELLLRMWRKGGEKSKKILRKIFPIFLKLRFGPKRREITEEKVREIFSKVKLKPEAKEIISYLKRKGYKVYLVSGAIDIYVEEIAKKLSVDGYYASASLGFNREGILERIYYEPNQGEKKIEALKDIAEKLSISIDEIVFVGDSDNDIDAFRVTGHGIVVNSSNDELNSVAWKKIKSLEEIKDIL